jgi:hypothetical protein
MRALFILIGLWLWAVTVYSQERKVLFIGIDGLRTDALQTGDVPNLRELMNTGMYTFESWHLGITMSGPSWSDMLTGVWEAKHGVTSNNYTGSKYNLYPYFVKRAKEVDPTLYAVQVTSWSPMSDNVYNDGWDLKVKAPDDLGCKAVAVSQLANIDLDILFVHFDNCDKTGHRSGFHTSIPTYMSALKGIDGMIGEVIAALKARPTYNNEDWLILLTTDHGGIGLTHGGNSNDERAIWWIANGKNIPNIRITGSDPGSYQMGNLDPEKVKNTPVLTDIAVTALHHLLQPKGINPEERADWDLDGKSWLNFATYVEESKAGKSFGVYPNPNNGVFVAVFQNPMDAQATWQLRNAPGSVVTANENGTVTERFDLNLADVAPGIYVLEVILGTEKLTRKVVIR